ncbi:MAG: fibronectin type III domain-containing protein [Candidatus Thermoplasmatota archaeon]|nr:fibronectin type III domain-containing protein [Candidatus Thermoplasmatota archaeon]
MGIPSAPLSLNITVESYIIRVSWEPPADDGGSRIWSYTVYRYDPEQIKTENFGISVTDTYLGQNDVDVERGRTYEYWVVANNDVGEGEATDRVGAMMEEKDDSVDIVSWILTVFVILIIIAILSVVMILVIRRNNESCNDRRDTDHKGRRYR